MIFETEIILSQTGLFWQYPVKTEEVFYEQNKDKVNFCGIPWATILDKRVNMNQLFKYLIPFFKHKDYYTCCQHISFRKLIPLMKLLGIKTIYTPHKVIGEDYINDVELKPCPLYAVNIEDPKRNEVFNNKDFENYERKYLYSFMGGVQNNYLSSIRNDIFNMQHSNNTFIKNTGQWHFNNIVYSNKQNKKRELNIDKKHIDNTEKYNNVLLNSRFSLCPSGSGPNTIRFWESLAIGSIPILLSDTLELPHDFKWDDAIIRIPEKELANLPNILQEISVEQEQKMRKKCIEIYNKLKNNFSNKKNKTLTIFSNCHGEKYLNIFKRDTNINKLYNINYIISYNNLNKFNQVKHKFEDADIIIINNIKNYKQFSISNLKKITKPDCKFIIIPFLRFNGYWFNETFKNLKYIGGNSVSYFPNINNNEIDSYLNKKIDPKLIISNFNFCLTKLKEIEDESDIKFYEFFIKNHLKYPMFRDYLHPTQNIIEYIGRLLIYKLINIDKNILYNEYEFPLQEDIQEYGHYKPIINEIKNVLGIKYDLDKVFLCSRKVYITTVNNIENNKIKIKDLDHMREFFVE